MTKGYIGGVLPGGGRDAEIDHMRQLIENWRLGYRGAVVLTGNRLSGKTLFGELITNRFFPATAIRLRPPHPGGGAGAAHQDDRGPCRRPVLRGEVYRTVPAPCCGSTTSKRGGMKGHTLAANVRALGEHIDDYSGPHLLPGVDHQRRIPPPRPLPRHRPRLSVRNQPRPLSPWPTCSGRCSSATGATHKVMVDPEGEPVSETTFGHMVKRIYRATEGNVGETINRWAYYTQRYDDERVVPARRPAVRAARLPVSRYRYPAHHHPAGEAHPRLPPAEALRPRLHRTLRQYPAAADPGGHGHPRQRRGP